MQCVVRQRMLLGTIALCGLTLGVAFSSTSATGENRVPAWCHSGQAWILYAEGIPGSATPEDFTACLRRSAEHGYVLRFDGQSVPGGALIDLGQTRLFWTLPGGHSLRLSITAYDDHVTFGDSCEREFELHGGAVRMTAPGYPCVDHERVREDSRGLTDVDFAIYVFRRQFVIDGPDGWYHVVRDQTGWNEDPTPRGEITLRGVNASIWVSTEFEAAIGGYVHNYRPVANTGGDPQQYFAYDWESRVRAELIPRSFNHTAQYLLPDRDAYWTEVRGWIDAIMEDLFHGRAAPVHLVVLDTIDSRGYADPATRTISTSRTSANTILHELAHIIAGADEGHDARFVATLLMLWQRYVPDFNSARAVELASHHLVAIAEPVHVEPESERTAHVHSLFERKAPTLPSDYEPIDPEELHFRVELEVGREYTFASGEFVTSSSITPACLVTEPYSDGTTSQAWHGPAGTFTIGGRGGKVWNGIEIAGFSNGEHGSYISGTPTTAGRVRVEVTTKCPGGSSQEPRLVGYSEVIVVDPNDDE